MTMACEGTAVPEPTPDAVTLRLQISAPGSTVALEVGSAPGCGTVAGGIELPLNADVAVQASFLNAAGETDPVAIVGSAYRLAGENGADPAPSAASMSFTRTDAFSGTLRGSVAATATISFRLGHASSGATAWGPCTLALNVVAPETTPTPWSTIAGSPESDGSHFQDGSFLSSQQGWVIGAPGTVYYTADGGANWEQRFVTAPTASTSFFRSVAFVSETKGWVGDLNRFNNPDPERSLWETLDGGRSWTNISNRITGASVTGICGMWVVDASTVVGVGRWNGPAAFVKTQDGGATWQSVSLAPHLTGAVDVYFFDAQSGLIGGARGVGNSVAQQASSRVVVMATTDGGATWSERFVGSREGAWSWKISFPTPSVGYIATQGPTSGSVVLKTLDGGLTWREIEISGATDGL